MSRTYPPLADARRALRVDWYRSPIDRRTLHALTERSDARGWLQAGGHLLLFIVTGAATWASWASQSWVAFFVALWLHGTVASFFSGVAPHELGHATVFRTRWLNKAFLYLFSLVGWWDPFDYAASHTHHHRFTQYPDADRENVLPLEPSLHPWLLLQLFTLNLFGRPGRTFGKGGLLWAVILTVHSAFGRHDPVDVPSREWLRAVHADQPNEHRRSILWSRTLLLFHGAVVAAALATGQWVVALIVTCPSFIASWASYFTGLPQHCGLRGSCPDFRKNTRSMKLDPVLEFLYWHMNWHTEHHMYAAVPCYNLKKLARAIADDMPEPRTLIGAWREMREIRRRQRSEPGYEFDTPLPETAGRAPRDVADALESSIGELAPEALR